MSSPIGFNRLTIPPSANCDLETFYGLDEWERRACKTGKKKKGWLSASVMVSCALGLRRYRVLPQDTTFLCPWVGRRAGAREEAWRRPRYDQSGVLIFLRGKISVYKKGSAAAWCHGNGGQWQASVDLAISCDWLLALGCLAKFCAAWLPYSFFLIVCFDWLRFASSGRRLVEYWRSWLPSWCANR